MILSRNYYNYFKQQCEFRKSCILQGLQDKNKRGRDLFFIIGFWGEAFSVQHEALLCALPKNPDSVWTIDMEPLFGAAEV